MKRNLEIYNEYAADYQDYKLVLSERKILSMLRERWHRTRMLDIGVGTGRTTYTFGPIVKDYIGIDYSPVMIDKCREVIGESDTVKFYLQDATDLSIYYEDKFDFVLFSMNGICSVGHDDRLKILLEVHKVMADDGYFFFSTHSLHSFPDHFPFSIDLPRYDARKPLHWAYHWSKLRARRSRVRRIYRNIDVDDVCNQPWAELITGDHDFKMTIYHIKPDYQVKQLMEAGFDVVAVFDEEATERVPERERINGYMYFLCRKAEG